MANYELQTRTLRSKSTPCCCSLLCGVAGRDNAELKVIIIRLSVTLGRMKSITGRQYKAIAN